jgi:hypothetical protein
MEEQALDNLMGTVFFVAMPMGRSAYCRYSRTSMRNDIRKPALGKPK